jgi:7-cyano-7-deazaguanine reductase
MSMLPEFRALGKKIREARQDLETFDCPSGVDLVTLTSDEFSSLCPVTGQPDFSTVKIAYIPDELCLESKSLKLYLWTFRDEGHFCEALSSRIAHDVMDALWAKRVEVEVTQRPRGGITIFARSQVVRDAATGRVGGEA